MRLRVTAAALFAVAAGILIFEWHSHHTFVAGPHLQSAKEAIAAHSEASLPLQQEAWTVFGEFAKSVSSLPPMGLNDSWQSKCNLFPVDCAGTGSSSFLKIEVNSVHQFKPLMKSDAGSFRVMNGESIFFDPTAQEALADCKRSNCPTGITFGKDSMIGRFAWYIIPRGPGPCQTIMIFDPSKDAATYRPSKPVEVKTPSCTKNTQFELVPLTDFVTLPITLGSNGNARAFQSSEGGMIFEPNDTVLLIGFHLIKKRSDEPNDWVWSTFWWSDDPTFGGGTSPTTGYSCAQSSACLPDIPNSTKWEKYVMNTVTQPEDDDEPFVAASNPYVDVASNSGPLPASCVVCHSFATSRKDLDAGQATSPRCGAQSAASMTPMTLKKAADDYEASLSPPRVPTDMVWALSKHTDTDPTGQTDGNYCTALAGH
jgi:hypothetical protein